MKLKKIIGISALSWLLPVLTFAAQPSVGTQLNQPVPEPKIRTVQDAYDTLNTISNYMFGGLMVLVVIFLIVAAFNYLTAAGDDTKVKKAKNGLIYAIYAVLIAVGAKAIIYVIGNFFTQ